MLFRSTPRFVQRAIAKAIEDTASNTGMTLTVAFDYGSRAEIVDAARLVVASGRPFSVDAMNRSLYDPEMPTVDVLVRTSGEKRVSNFLLWQSAGAPIHFTENTWPDFSEADVDAALAAARAA